MSDTPSDVDGLAAALVAARHDRRQIPLPSPGPADAEAAFAVQAKVAARLGPAGGWKIGGGNDRAPYSAAPIAIPLVRPSPSHWPAMDFGRIGIEAEVAFRIGKDFPAGSEAPSAEAVRGAIVSVHPAIEIVDSRFDVWPIPDPLAALADNQNNGGLVVETIGVQWEARESLERAHVTITVDGETVFDQDGANPGGDPVELVIRLVAHAVQHGGGLRAGTYVTTGSLNGIHFVQPGAAVSVSITGLGQVELTLVG